MEMKNLEKEIDKNVAMLSTFVQSELGRESPFLRGGTEFKELREYVPGEDPAKNIDWRASLRSTRLFVRRYSTPEKACMFLAQDCSASMAYGGGKWTKSEYASIVMGTLIKTCLKAQMSVGMGFSHPSKGMDNITKPTNHPGIYARFQNSMLKRKYEGKFNFKKLLQAAVQELTSSALLIILSDFLDGGEEWKDELLTASHKFASVLCFAIRDPIDENLPSVSKSVILQNPETKEVIVVNPRKVGSEYKKRMEEREKKLKRKIEGAGAMYEKVFTNEPFTKPLVRFLKK